MLDAIFHTLLRELRTVYYSTWVRVVYVTDRPARPPKSSSTAGVPLGQDVYNHHLNLHNQSFRNKDSVVEVGSFWYYIDTTSQLGYISRPTLVSNTKVRTLPSL